MKIKTIYVLLPALILCICAIAFRDRFRAVLSPGAATVSGRVEQYGHSARERLAPHFAAANVTYPPSQLTLVGLKRERVLEVWASGGGEHQLVRTYPVLAASGSLGPKLKEGDMQVPEGIYSVESLHPNSLYHLALRLDYPNDFDRAKGESDGRADLGGDIMIHGRDCSIGCLAMGDEAIEDLFVLAADTGIKDIKVILSPVDFRTEQYQFDSKAFPGWTSELYDSIKLELEKLKRR